MTAKHVPTMSEMAAAAGGRKPDIVCPHCRAYQFVATTTWWAADKDGKIMRRARECRACGYGDNETVPAPVRDNSKYLSQDTASPGNSDEMSVD